VTAAKRSVSRANGDAYEENRYQDLFHARYWLLGTKLKVVR
jgi:hypothetical protein